MTRIRKGRVETRKWRMRRIHTRRRKRCWWLAGEFVFWGGGRGGVWRSRRTRARRQREAAAFAPRVRPSWRSASLRPSAGALDVRLSRAWSVTLCGVTTRWRNIFFLNGRRDCIVIQSRALFVNKIWYSMMWCNVTHVSTCHGRFAQLLQFVQSRTLFLFCFWMGGEICIVVQSRTLFVFCFWKGGRIVLWYNQGLYLCGNCRVNVSRQVCPIASNGGKKEIAKRVLLGSWFGRRGRGGRGWWGTAAATTTSSVFAQDR